MGTVTRYVNTASVGGDGTTNATTGPNAAYATLSAWNTAEATDLVTAGDTHVVYFEGDETTDTLQMKPADGWTTGPGNEILISTLSANKHSGTEGSGNAVLRPAGRPIDVRVNYVTIEWLEVKDFNDASFGGIVNVSASNMTVRHCLIHDGTGSGIASSTPGASNVAHNNIIFGNSGDGIALRGEAYNNTVYNNGGTGVIKSTALTATNNISMAHTTADFGAAITQSYNLSSDTSASGTGSLVSKVASNQFASITGGAEDLHLKSGADAIDAGTDLGTTPANVNIDVDQRDRDLEGDTWDMGADEFVAAGGLSIPVAMHHRQMQGVS